MFNGKKKAITFSYDDGTTQDIRLIELLNKYGLKCTFNINSGLLGSDKMLVRDGMRISHYKIAPHRLREVYEGHEVAVHTLTHPKLISCSDDEIVRQVEDDRIALEEALTISRGQITQDLISLYKALGGGVSM